MIRAGRVAAALLAVLLAAPAAAQGNADAAALSARVVAAIAVEAKTPERPGRWKSRISPSRYRTRGYAIARYCSRGEDLGAAHWVGAVKARRRGKPCAAYT